MSSRVKRWPLAAVLVVLAGCGTQPVATAPQPAASATPEVSADTTPEVTAERQPLLPDPSAEHTVGDAIRLSGGEFVGDQADLVVEEAVLLGPIAEGSGPAYAFLVEITGLDPETLPYNLRDFSLFDDEAFEYQPLFDGGEEPRLEFGDLSPGQGVRGWLTFEGPTDPAYVELVYAPALALEPAHVRVLVP
jgi:hypothetical protein